MIPAVLRGITPDELGEGELSDDKFGGPPKVYSSSGESGDGSQEEAEPLGREVTGAVPDEEEPLLDTDMCRLTTGVAPGDPLVFSHEYCNDAALGDPEDEVVRALG